MKLRAHLIKLTVVTLLPMVALAVLAALLFLQREREIFQRGATERTRALLTALDSELNGTIAVLTALATSRSLEIGDLRAFHGEAARVLAGQPDWFTINLAPASARQVVNAMRPFGSELNDIADRPSFERVWKTAKPAIGDLVYGRLGSDYQFAVRVPVRRNGAIEYVLSAVVKPVLIHRLLAPQKLPPDWVGVVLDRSERIVARTVEPQTSVGKLASDSLRSALARAPTGWFHGSTIEGAEVYTPYARSEFSGWTFAMGIPAATVEAGQRTTIWTIGGGIAAAILVALVFARALGRRIAEPIVTLAASAVALGRGERPEISVSRDVAEVGDLAGALDAAAAAVRAREETQGRLAAIVDFSHDAILRATLDGKVLTWNHGAEELFGYSADEIIGRDVVFLVPPELADERQANFAAVRRGESRVMETVRLKKDGTRVAVEVSVSPIREAGGAVIGVSAMIRDITERKRLEGELQKRLDELKEADRRKDEFIATLSHELRNPLAPIRNAVQVLRAIGPADRKLQWCRDLIDQQVSLMARLMEDLLDVSRITRNKLELRKQLVDLRSVIDDAVAICRPQIDAGGHRLTVELPRENIVLDGDRARLTQVFANLINNAGKYSEKNGSIEIVARLEPILDFGFSSAGPLLDYSDSEEGARQQALLHNSGQATDNEKGNSSEESGFRQSKIDNPKCKMAVVVSVLDAGIGIAPEKLPHVFDMFFQAEGGQQGRYGGLGIGLTLVRNLVELHGGTVEAKSAGLGKGSEFVVRLPVVASGEWRVAPPENIATPHSSLAVSSLATVPTRKRVLVVDDNKMQAQSLAMLLELMGYEVRTAHDGASALALIAEFLPKVALIDIGLPGMNGYELAARLRELPQLSGLTLIAQTGWGREADREQSRRAGFQHHLTKPIDHPLLEKILGEIEL